MVRLNIDKKYADFCRKEIKEKNVLGFKTADALDLYMFLFAIGVNEGYRSKLKAKDAFILDLLSSNNENKLMYYSFIHSVALQELLKEGKENEINNMNIVYGIADEYVNTGNEVLKRMIDSYQKFDNETFIYEMIEKLNKKIEEIE